MQTASRVIFHETLSTVWQAGGMRANFHQRKGLTYLQLERRHRIDRSPLNHRNREDSWLTYEDIMLGIPTFFRIKSYIWFPVQIWMVSLRDVNRNEGEHC